MEKLKKRSEMDNKFCWNMQDMFDSDLAWEKAYKEMLTQLPTLEKYQRDTDLTSAELLEVLNLYSAITEKMERIYVYANQKSHEDMTNSTYQDMASKAQSLMIQKQAAFSFMDPSIMQIGRDKIEKYRKVESGLDFYERYLHELFRQSEHILNAEQEQLLAKAAEISEAASDIFAMFNNADLKFADIHDEEGKLTSLTNGRYIHFLQSRNRKVREEAFHTLYSEYAKYENMLAATFRSNVKQHMFFAEARKYSSALAFSLDDANIPVSVYERLLEAVHDDIDLLHRYMQIRKSKMQVEELHMYDLYVPLVQDVDLKISYQEAKDIVKRGLVPLGEDYLQVLDEGLEGGWIDEYENEGKRGGAYSWGAYGVHPYVLLNHQENLNSVFTLAHEMGHALHSYYSDQNQPCIYAGYKIFVAEVASTFNEALLVRYLIDHSKDTENRKYLINYFLEQFRTTFYRQSMFAEFEKTTHEKSANGETLTPELLCSEYKKLNELYFGEALCVDDDIKYEWARIPHFYNPFYRSEERRVGKEC